MSAVIGEQAPAFSLPDADGRLRTSAEFLGTVVVLELTRHLY